MTQDATPFRTITEDGIELSAPLGATGQVFKKCAKFGFQTVQALAGHVVVLVEPKVGAPVIEGQTVGFPVKDGWEKYHCAILPYPGCLRLDNGRVLEVDSAGEVAFARPETQVSAALSM